MLVVGRGTRGRFWEHLVRRHPATALVGTVDPDERAGANWDALGPEALAEADGAIIASPPVFHSEQTLACLRTGLAVLVEKPLALELGGARALAEAAQSAERPVVVAQNFAERGLERGVEAALAALGPLQSGSIVSARARWAMPAHLSGVEHPILWDFGIHHFDLIRRRAGATPEVVVARQQSSIYRASFLWSSGLEVSWWHDNGGELFHRAEWWRAAGGAVEVRDGRAWRVMEGRRRRQLRLPRGSAEMRLLDALISGHSNLEQNLETVAMTVATAAAIDTGTDVEVAEVRSWKAG
jgi:predicted dehydrogenase